MTYFTFLILFLGAPISLLLLATAWDRRTGRSISPALRNFSPWLSVLIHILVALVYTTPWDNYLVATGVWFYDPALVTGVTLGWVPIEEYTFFVVQTFMTGLWVLFLARRLRFHEDDPDARSLPRSLRRSATLALGLLWVGSVALLGSGWAKGDYLGLILVWALPPIMLQTAYGADLLWRYRRLALPGLLVPTLYLAAADTLAISAGTWTIEPSRSLEVFLPGGLPLEELVFFLVTNVLVTFGITLILACESRGRARSLLDTLLLRRIVNNPE